MFQFSDVLIFQKSPRLPLSTASCLPPVTKVCHRENLATNPAGMEQNQGLLEWNQRHRTVPGWKMSTIHTEVRVRPDFLLLHLTICSNIYRNRTRLAPKWQICDLKWYSNVIGFFSCYFEVYWPRYFCFSHGIFVSGGIYLKLWKIFLKIRSSQCSIKFFKIFLFF